MNWTKYTKEDISTHPPKYGRYVVYRNNGQIHFEVWNGLQWAYNDAVISFYMEVKPPNKY